MIRIIYLYIIFGCLALLMTGCENTGHDRKFSEQMVACIDSMQGGAMLLHGNRIHSPEIIRQIYDTGNGLVEAKWDNWVNIDQLLNSIRNAYYHGLQPEDYHLSALYDLMNKVIASEETDFYDSVAFELLLTDSFLLLASHLSEGKTIRGTDTPRWTASGSKPGKDWKGFLENSLDEQRVFINIEQLAPAHDEYIKLIDALEYYRQVEEEGGWVKFDTGQPKLEKGMRHPDVVLLRKRLSGTRHFGENDTADLLFFDDNLHDQVAEFQKRNGLAADGVVGPATAEALGYSVYENISTIKTNLERWRRLDDLGDHYIVVNIPDYRLSVIKEGKTMLTSDVVVGQRHRQTPVLSSELTKMELNPFWFVPPGMLKHKIIPTVRRDIEYLERNNMVVLDKDWRRVDPGSVDWHSGFGEGFPYIIRQNPGPGNEMGRIKFLFPNRHFVTIHGTPYTHLFRQNIRAFSAGCIRIRTPLQLAEYLLNNQEDWTMGQLLEVLDSNEFRRVEFVNPLSLHILYFTAWAGEDGVTNFRKDIYSLDPPLLEALQQHPPGYEHEISVQLPAGLAATDGELRNQANQ